MEYTGSSRRTGKKRKKKEMFKMKDKIKKAKERRAARGTTLLAMVLLLMYAVLPLAFATSDRGGRQVTSLDISKDVDLVEAPGFSATLDKEASADHLAMEVGESAPVSFTITVNAAQTGAYHINGNIYVQNTGEWPALVTAVSDTVWYKAGGPSWLPAPTSVTTTVPSVIPVGGPHVYAYSGTFTLPVPLASVTAMSNLIEITISNHPDGTHLFHYRLSFPKPAASGSTAVLQDLETITPALGLTYTIDSVTVNGVPASLNGPWTLDLSQAPHTVIINKTLHASAAGEYILNNLASLGDLTDEVDVHIHVPGVEPEPGAIEGLKSDSSLSPLAGVEIQLWRDGELIASTFTAEDGSYRFEGLEAGSYQVREVVPEGWYAVSSEAVDLELEAGATVRADFVNERLVEPEPGAIEGLKSDSSLSPLAGVEIQLWRDGELIASTFTAEDGSYRFEGLEAGSYQVREVVPEGWYAVSSEAVDLELEAGATVRADFVNERYSSIAGHKWHDLNANGVHEAEEPGLGGVLITLKGEDLERQAVTAADGSYYFAGLLPGEYEVKEVVPSGWANTSPASLSVTLGAGQDLIGIDFLNAEVEVGGIVVEPPEPPAIGQVDDGNTKSLPLTGFEQLTWLLAAAFLSAMGLAAVLLGALRRREE